MNMGVKIVSTCLFGGPQASRHRSCPGGGSAEFYRRYLPAWVRAHHNVYSGWRWTLHHDDECFGSDLPYSRELMELADADLVDLVSCGTATERNAALLWRLKPLFDPLADIVICRDLDSLPTPLDRACVRDFMACGLAVAHGINDSISHCFALGGGMCGFWAHAVRAILAEIGVRCWDDLLAMAGRGSNWRRPGQEQQFLNGPLLRLLRNQTIVHDLNRAPDIGYAELCVGRPGPEHDPIKRAANNLMPHLGASGFDVERAVDFWQVNGDPEIEQRIALCESFGPDRYRAGRMCAEGAV